jgi:hypothetical protein
MINVELRKAGREIQNERVSGKYGISMEQESSVLSSSARHLSSLFHFLSLLARPLLRSRYG